MKPISILFITHNRLEYSQEALEALLDCKQIKIHIYDNGSTDGTRQWLLKMGEEEAKIEGITFNDINIGIAGAMNQFLNETPGELVVGKVDNDTIVPADFISKMLPHLQHADIVQAKHHVLKATHPDGFDKWVESMPAVGALRFNHFVGGSGILFKRKIVDRLPVTEHKLMGWRQWQREHPEIKKAFATDVEVKLLDTDETGARYEQYPEYYKQTGRL